MSIIGLILKASYQLNRHRVGPVRLNLLPLLFALASGLIWRGGHLTSGQLVSIIVLCLILVLVTLLAKRQGFVIFRLGGGELSSSLDCLELVPDEKVAVRASGLFEVRDKQCYFVEVAADFATMETREHIVMARMLNVRFLVGTPKDDAGWWYIFFKPHTVRRIEIGQVHFGLRARPAVKLEYETGKGKVEPVYLSFDEALQMQRVLEDLRRDAVWGQALPLPVPRSDQPV
jgi:hypothetical protein